MIKMVIDKEWHGFAVFVTQKFFLMVEYDL
jgi:hypothetical protein